MKVLQVNYTDVLGHRFNGGAMATWLRGQGHEASQAVAVKRSLDGSSFKLFPDVESGFGSTITNAIGRIETAISLQSVFYPQSFLLPFSPEFRASDLVHYHIIHNHFFSYLAFPLLSRLKPTVWSLHDPWAITGHCVHPFDCVGWKTGCSPCPHLDYPFVLRQDRASLNYNLKKISYRNSRLNLVVGSRWMKDLVEQSPLLCHFPVHHIPFGLDLNVFAPREKANAKSEFGLFGESVVIGLRALQGPYKGYEFALAALEALPDNLPIQILTCQSRGLFDSLREKFPVVDLGEIHGDQAMAKFFNATDIHLMPSMAESFGMMAMEAAACGVPSVVFSGSPLEEVCFAPEGGMAVSRGNVNELTAAIVQLTVDSYRKQEMGQRARLLAVQHYCFDDYARSMLALYDSLLRPKLCADRSTEV